MADTLYPAPSRELSDVRKRLAPDIHDAFQTFSQKVLSRDPDETRRAPYERYSTDE